MNIIFANGATIDLVFNSSPLASIYQKIYQHLQHLPIPFRDWDNPFYLKNVTHQDLVDALIFYGNKVSVQVDRDLCVAQDQNYLNKLHSIYEKNYCGESEWLDFHEHIHLCEKSFETKTSFLLIDYRQKAGMLEKPFDPQWAKNSTTKVKAGDVFVAWAELGKTPYNYWTNQEPNNIDRMRELIKPWLLLKPKIRVALDDVDALEGIDIDAFESWWSQYSTPLCQHWNQPSWTTHDIFSVPVFARVPNIQELILLLKNNVNPVRISL